MSKFLLGSGLTLASYAFARNFVIEPKIFYVDSDMKDIKNINFVFFNIVYFTERKYYGIHEGVNYIPKTYMFLRTIELK